MATSVDLARQILGAAVNDELMTRSVLDMICPAQRSRADKGRWDSRPSPPPSPPNVRRPAAPPQPPLRGAPPAGRYDEPMAAQPTTALPVHRLDLDTYNRMVACGALEGQRVELLEGAIVDMSPKSPAHVVVVSELVRHFAAAPRWWMQVQDPIEVPPDSEPEPDLALASQRPAPGQLLRTASLVVEVAVSSHVIDRKVKARLYACAPIPVYWLVDVPGRTVEVRTQPGPDGYGHCEPYREGSLVPSPLEGVEDLDIAALLADVEG
jgi:Uma2 family endonuclease